MKRTTLLLIAFVLLGSGCKNREGCADSKASNYDEEATKDNGTCVYMGCTDQEAYNYDPSALEDDGSCRFPGEVRFYSTRDLGNGKFIDIISNNQYIGRLQTKCTGSGIDCSSPCASVLYGEIEANFINYTAYYATQISFTVFDTIEVITGTATVNSNECSVAKL